MQQRIVPHYKRRRQSASHAVHAPPSADAPHPKIDLWLPRLSHLAQFGLFVITIGSLYFTVLPLYQKAILEEAIAKREIELKEATSALERAYARIRSYALRDFRVVAPPSCTRLWRQPPLPPTLGGDPNIKRLPLDEEAFGIPIGECLLKAARDLSSLKELKEADKSALLDEVAKLGSLLERQRVDARARFQGIPTTLTPAEADAMKLDGIRAFLLAERTKLLGIEATRSERRLLAIALSQEKIAYGYEQTVSSAIRNLRISGWETQPPPAVAVAASAP